MRILSYQGWDTLEVLSREGVYRPIPDLSIGVSRRWIRYVLY